MRYRELMQSCLAGESLSISPVAAWQHKPEIDQTVADFAAATVAEQQRYDFDFAKLTPASTWQSIDQGLTDCWNNDYLGRRQIVKQNITAFPHWALLRERDVWQGFTGNILQAARLAKANLPPHVPLLVTIFNPFFQAVQQAGLPLVLATQHQEPALLQAGLQILLSNTLALIAECKAIGVDGIFFVSQHATSHMLSPETYAALALPADLACIKAIEQMPFSMLHLHGTQTHMALFNALSIPLHCDHVDAQEFAYQQTHFKKLAGTLAPDALLLRSGEDDVAQAVINQRLRLQNKCYIVSPGCALPLHVSAANILAMVNAARRPLAPFN